MNRPQAGDIISVSRVWYRHYGIFAGAHCVIHFAPKSGFELSPKDAYIQETTLESFLKGGRLMVDKVSSACFSPEETVQRAKSCLGTNKGEYDLVFNNCEHFARWCKSGHAQSDQVKGAVAVVVTTAAVTAAAIVVADTPVSGVLSKKD